MIIYSVARSAAEIDEVFQLRYRVSCLERKMEREEAYPLGREKDRFDSCAIHAIARHYDLITVGTARLVFRGSLGLPLEKGWRMEDTANVAELSKLAISRLALGVSGAKAREVVIGLLRTLCRESRSRGIQRWYVQLTTGMSRLFQIYGLPLIPVGQAPSPADASLYEIEIRHLEEILTPSQKVPLRPDLRRHRCSTARGSRTGFVTCLLPGSPHPA